MVDAVGEIGIESAQRIIRQCRQVKNSIKAIKIISGQITDIFTNLRNLLGWISELAPRKEICIQTNHFVASRTEDGSGHCSDVTLMTSQKNSHSIPIESEVNGADSSDKSATDVNWIDSVGMFCHSSDREYVNRSRTALHTV